MKRIIIYTRVSTDEQSAHGISLDEQKVRCTAYGVALGLEDPEVIVDAGYSAKSLKRPGMQAVLEAVRGRHIDTVIVTKLDRITRSLSDLLNLLDTFAKHGVKLLSVTDSLNTDSAAGRMVIHMLGVVAQWERETIAERVSSVLAHKRRGRTAYGVTPFGFRREGDVLVMHDDEQRVVAEMQQSAVRGTSLCGIARSLNARGIRPHRGRQWYASSVASVLRSKITMEGG